MKKSQTNAATKTAEQQADKPAKRGKVLSEKDIAARDGLGKTSKELRTQHEQELRKEVRESGAPRAAAAIAAAKQEAAGLAKGVDGRSAPHSAKSMQDGRAKAKASNKADAKGANAKATVDKKAARKAERAAKSAPKADDNRKITILNKKFEFGREGTARRLSWDTCMKSKTVADYAAAGGKLKYLPRWATAGAIKLA
jgi:hypothetical protein